MEFVLEALKVLFQPVCLLLVAGGAILGMVMGAIPGLSGGLAITLLLPMCYSLNRYYAIAMLIGIWVGSMSGSCIGSILLGIPGTASSIATVYDGYELTKQGNPVRALSAAVCSNFIGTFPSILVAMLLCPFIAKIAVMIGPAEYFALAFMAITMVIGLSDGSVLKGLLSVGFAVMFQCVGYAPVSGTPRFTFGSYYLAGGFNLICIAMGLFAGKTILFEYARNTKQSESERIVISGFKFPGKDLISNIGNIIRSFLIGLWVGFLPGLGGALSNVVAYSLAKSSSKHPEEFGKGCIDGVIAPEVANNASIGGALTPMISLGIPGDSTTALLLGGLTIFGVEAGPLMQSDQPVFVYMIYMAAIIGAIGVLLFQTLGMRLFPSLLKVPYHFLYPVILILCFVGAYCTTNNNFSVFASIAFTVFGIAMSYFDLPQSPFMLTFVLANTLETNLRKAVSYADNGFLTFVTRPVSLILLIIGLACIVIPLIKRFKKKGAAK